MNETPTEERARVLGHYSSVVTRSRKGRSSFRVIGRPRRYLTGTDPIREALDALTSGDPVRLDGIGLAALADAYVRMVAPDLIDPQTCVCDDLTDVWDVRWDATAGDYVRRERRVRACHCAAFPKLLGTDARSWEQITAGSMSTGRTRARVTLRRTVRQSDPVETSTSVCGPMGTYVALLAPAADLDHVWIGHKLIRRPRATRSSARANAARDARRAARYEEHLAREIPADEQAIADVMGTPGEHVLMFPGVTLTVRVSTSSAATVRLTRGTDAPITFRARTATAIARRAFA